MSKNLVRDRDIIPQFRVSRYYRPEHVKEWARQEMIKMGVEV